MTTEKVNLIGTVTQPKTRLERFVQAIETRFGLPIETGEWHDHGGWLYANISVSSRSGRVAKTVLRDIRMFAEGFVAADGAKFD